MATSDFTTRILKAFADAMEPLTDAVSSQDKFGALLAELGWLLDSNASMGSIQNAFQQPVSAIATLATDISTGKEISQLGTDITNVVTALGALENASFAALPQPLNQASFWRTFPRDILELLIYRYIKRDHLLIFGGLSFIGVLRLDPQQPDLASGRQAFNRMTVDWNQLPKAVAAPSDLFKNVYGWGGDFDHTTFLETLAYLLQGAGVAAQIYPVNEAFLDIYYDPSNPTRKQVTQLVTSPFQLTTGGAIPTAFIKPLLFVMPVPPKADATLPPEGIVLFPYVTGGMAGTLNLEPGIDLTLEGGFDVDLIRVVLRPGLTEVELPAPTLDLSAKALLHAKRAAPWIIAGDADSTRLELWEAHVALFLQGPIGKFEFKVEAAADDGRLILDFSESDGFLQTILGSDPQTLNLSPGIVWSNRTGFALQGQAALEASVPVHQSIAGLVAVDTIYVSLLASAAAGSVRLVVAATGALTLGPLEVSIDRVGLAIDLKPRDLSNPGNLGALDLSFGFKAPNGLGIAINASAVTGGGYLFFDADKEQYAGVLQLELAETIAIKAIGLLTTRMPDGSEGFSLLVIITAEGFAPIELGFGFTLTGIGGLLGVNRTAAVTTLRSGIKNGTLGSILFPADPVRNAPRIVSDVGTVFPVALNRYVFGPMVMIDWGTPALLKLEIGLVLEVPDPVRLLILGRLKATLPDEENPLAQICMDALGVIDFATSQLSLDATLYDSRLLSFVLTGDMAMRANWGDNPNFLLAIGGWNPRLPAPAGFPALSRMALTLSTNENARLRLEAYLAVTSNTVQFGARVDFYFAVQPFSVEGYLGFDALFHFAPFSFIADLSASVALRASGTILMSVGLDMTLSGPSPWHVWGVARFSVLGFKQSISFDAQYGPDQQPVLPAAVDVKALLTAALSDARNWSSELPASERPLVVFRASSAAGNAVRVHPLAELAVRERVVPLDLPISKFGNAPVSGDRQFSLKAVRSDDGSAIPYENIIDSFALAQFVDMSDDQKLSSPAFTQEHVGIRFTTREFAYEYEPALDSAIAYETLVISSDQPEQPSQSYVLPAAVLDGTATFGAAARAATRRPGRPRVRAA